jgi:hypothetical protein
MSKKLDPTARANLIAIFREYRRATGLAMSTVSQRFYGNSSFIDQYAAGRTSVSLEKLDEMLAELRSTWPDNAQWPMTRAIFMDR